MKALTLSLSTTRQFYRAIAGFSGFLSSGYGLIQVTAINKPSCCSKAIYWAVKVVIHKSKVHYNFICVVLSENVFLQTVSGISTYNKRRGKNVTVRISNSHLPLTKSFRVERSQKTAAKDGHDTATMWKRHHLSVCVQACVSVCAHLPQLHALSTVSLSIHIFFECNRMAAILLKSQLALDIHAHTTLIQYTKH